MIEIRISADEIDYEKLAQYAAPYLSEYLKAKGGVAALLGKREETLGKIAVQLVKSMSEKDREELAVRLISENRNKIEDRINNFLLQKNIGVHVGTVSVCQTD